MKIKIDEYNAKAFEFTRAYLKYWEPNWLGIPPHRLVSPAFWKTLNDGDLDSDEYTVVFNPDEFAAEECAIIQRYYFAHLANYKQNIIDNTNMGRVFMELGPTGSIFQNKMRKRNSSKSIGGRSKSIGGRSKSIGRRYRRRA
jgi:hypothetical protein